MSKKFQQTCQLLIIIHVADVLISFMLLSYIIQENVSPFQLSLHLLLVAACKDGENLQKKEKSKMHGRGFHSL